MGNRKKHKTIVILLVLASLLFSTPSFAGMQMPHVGRQGSSGLISPALSSPQSNPVYLNGTETYYTNAGQTSSGSVTIISLPNYYLNSTYISPFSTKVGTTQSINSTENIDLGTYQYFGYTGVGNGLLNDGSYAEVPNMAIAFGAGVSVISTGCYYNVGTIYAILTMINVSSGNQIQTTWQYIMNAEWYSGGVWSLANAGVIFSPSWYPNAPGGTYAFYLYIGVTPYQNYNGVLPSYEETTSNSGFALNEFNVSYPNSSYVEFEDGWTYNGLTESGLSVYGYSPDFYPSFPQNTVAYELSFSSPFAVEMYISTSSGTYNTFQKKNGSFNSTYLPNAGCFGDINGLPNVQQFSVNWSLNNVIITNSQNLNLISTGTITENGSWFNTTGSNAYQFQYISPSGALNGQVVDGIQWDTTVTYTISHILDYGYGSPVNIFSINGKNISSPGLYNSLQGSINDNNLKNTIQIDVNTTDFVIFTPTTFTESNLPLGTWYVNLSNGMTGKAAAGSSIILYLSNGTYSYTVSTSNKLYHSLSQTGIANVSGNTAITIHFDPTIYQVEFKESGLPFGTLWYVNITGDPSSGAITHNSYNVSLQNGSYLYTIVTINKTLEPSQSSGSFMVNNATVLNSVIFTSVNYTAKFTESGLPSGMKWYVNLTNGIDSKAITGSSYSITLINGTYSYSISTNDKTYLSSIPFGSFSINGSSVSKSIAFSEVKYKATFTESGLPSRMEWYVNLTNGQSFTSTSSTISFSLINGSYTYSISTSGKLYETPSGSFAVNGNPVSKFVAFSPVNFTVTFTEFDLPSNTTWYVNLSNGQSFSTTFPSISFSEFNGTYFYNISTTNKTYETLPSSGSFMVNGSSVSKIVSFSEVNYAITFNEFKLPSNAIWYVNLSDVQSFSSSTNTITFAAPNGSYSYTISTTDKIYDPSLHSGSFTVNGTSFSNSITFSEVKYNITFTETGLTSGTIWYVNLSNGIDSGPITGISYTLLLANGSYSYTIGNLSNYSVSPLSGSVSVNGVNKTTNITFTPINSSSPAPPTKSTPPTNSTSSHLNSPLFNLPSTVLYSIIISGIIAGIVVLSLIIWKRKR